MIAVNELEQLSFYLAFPVGSATGSLISASTGLFRQYLRSHIVAFSQILHGSHRALKSGKNDNRHGSLLEKVLSFFCTTVFLSILFSSLATSSSHREQILISI